MYLDVQAVYRVTKGRFLLKCNKECLELQDLKSNGRPFGQPLHLLYCGGLVAFLNQIFK